MASVEPTQLKALATRVRRQTSNREIVELCDGLLGLNAAGGCPECAKRRAAKAATQKRWRANKRSTKV